jgi:hypothetical protein
MGEEHPARTGVAVVRVWEDADGPRVRITLQPDVTQEERRTTGATIESAPGVVDRFLRDFASHHRSACSPDELSS